MKLYSKLELIEELKRIAAIGWMPNHRQGNDGSVGNVLEDLLGIEENNLPIPNASEWELKAQRLNSKALTTLKHIEPSPRAIKFVPQVGLLKYGWKHELAGIIYPDNEMSFRLTIHGKSATDRGFIIKIDRESRRVLVSFNSKIASTIHAEWLKTVNDRIGLGELNPQPYWGFDDLEHTIGTKLMNCFYVQARMKKIMGKEYFHYCKVQMLEKFKFDGFLAQLEAGNVLIDFDARTGHNHGTKFRMRKNALPELYQKVTTIVDV
ncbi:MAG: MvaI/BcnI restriction endonuclease family protein [Candidatus Kapabacteria bacterium]|nr:MvaI/BcnI restriction endonuclease family protein [Candidatus Kapabacteria bacterium]